MIRRLLTILLLVFVALGLSWSFLFDGGSPTPESGDTATTSAALTAYYFHGNFRCTTCRTIESLTQQTLADSFSVELAEGLLSFQPVNTDLEANAHFVNDFELSSGSVVLARRDTNSTWIYRRLDDVWNLVNDEEAFRAYIWTETSDMLSGQNS